MSKKLWTRVALLILVSLSTITWSWNRLAWEPPQAASVRRDHTPSDAQLLARDGRLLHERRIDPTRRSLGWTPLQRISPALVKAVLRSEDRRFFEHPGVDARGLLSAAIQQLSGTRRRGGSTISMQLAALLDADLRPARGKRRSWSKKIRQVRAAVDLESQWKKEEILEAYLNLVPFRGEVEGIGAAAGVWLGKDPHGIDDAEASLLAVLLRAPSAPRELVLRRAHRLMGILGPDDELALQEAAERIFSTPNRRGPTPRLAPHLAQRLLAKSPPVRRLRSTIDADLQSEATRILAREVGAAQRHNVRDGAVVVLHNRTGEVLAYVGNSGPRATARYVDGTRARRQAGSTLKPFLYGLALERRLLTASSLLEDSPLEVAIARGAVYRPRNYDEGFRGPVSLRTALASSLNIPAVRTQALLGEPAFVERLHQLGFTGLNRTGDHYGPSLSLGSAEVSLLELANAYRTLARGGRFTPLRFELPGPSDPDTPFSRRVYPKTITFLLADILSDRDARSATFGLENALATPFWTAVKTGTTKDMRDNWCVGFSTDYTVAVWVGNYSGEPMHGVSGVSGAAPTWLALMSLLHRDHSSQSPQPPPGMVRVRVALPGQPERDEWFLAGTEPASHRIRAAEPPAQILSPADEAVLALDPAIPRSRQKMILQASRASPRLTWNLDGVAIGNTAQPRLVSPSAGRHRLRLMEDSGREMDEIHFFVKDTRPPTQARNF